MSTVIRNGLVVTQNARREIFKGDVLVEDGRIAALGQSLRGDEVLDAKGCAVIPGLINAHGHVSMTLMRAVADDLNLEQFLEKTFAVDAKRQREDVYAGSLAGCAEMLLSGTTTFLDMYYHEDAVAQAVKETGMRGYLGWAILDDDKTTQKGSPLKNCEKFARAHRGNPLVKPLAALQGVYVCSKETFLGARELAEKEDMLLHMHLQETRHEVHEHEKKNGKRPVAWLDEIGFLNPRLSAAHCVWMTINEIKALKKNGVAVAHCPVSNAKLASGGVAPVPEMFAEGLAVGLGTDGTSSNNCLDMFQEMKFCALTHKAQRWDATVLPAQKVLDMATIEGAKLLHAGKEIGSIDIGKSADLAIVDMGGVWTLPTDERTVVSNLVYSCTGDRVRDVMVAGDFVVRERKLAKADLKEIVDKGERAARGLRG